MESDHIKCPQCGTEIEVGEVLAAQVTVAVEARVRHEAEAKLKDDQRSIGANLAVLVSTELPEGTKPTDTVAYSACGTGGFLLAA